MTFHWLHLLKRRLSLLPTGRSGRQPRQLASRRQRPRLELLEDRLTPTPTPTGHFYRVTTLAEGAGVLTTGGHAGTQADPYLDTTLRGAVAAATTDAGTDTIVFDASLTASGAATITLSTVGNTTLGASDLGISTNVTIQGSTGNNGITLNNSGSQRLFYVSAAGSLTVKNLTLQGGLAQGFSGAGGAAGLGGAIFNKQGTVTLMNSTLSGNTAQGGAGGNGSNQGYSGGGGVGSAGSFTGAGGGPNGGVNSAGGFGGGGSGSRAGGLNGGFGGGGGSGYFGAGNGGFGGGGGGILDSAFSGGTTGFGGGNGTYGVGYGAGGGGAGMGGGIFNYQGTVTITNSTIAGNSARGGSGVGGNNPSGNGSGLGGGVFNYNGSLIVLNATLASNTVTAGTSVGGSAGSAAGGGIYSIGDGNSPNGNIAAAVTLNNSILAYSTSGASDFRANTINGGSTVSSGVGNLIQSQTGFSGTIVSAGNPLLGSLADNSGPTPTLALQSGSPALDAGNDAAASGLATDQRGAGFLRVVGAHVDIGAFEFVPLITNVAPAFTSGIPTSSVAAGQTYSFTFTASGTPTPTLSGSGLPAWLTFTPASGVLTGSTTVAGLYSNIQITATNAAGSVSTTFSITVTPGTASQLSVTGPTTVTAGASTTYTVTAQDQYGNTATGYTNTATITSTDSFARLPVAGNVTLTNGVGTTAVTFRSGGSFSLSASGPNVTAGQLTPIVSRINATMQNGVVVDDDALASSHGQRSLVRYLTVTFQGDVVPSAGQFSLLKMVNGVYTTSIGLAVGGATLVNGNTQVTLTFKDPSVAGTSLADGRYQLNYQGTALTTFFRLYGDINGDGQVDPIDQKAFTDAANTRRGTSIKYNQYFDYYNLGAINATDNSPFQARSGKKLDALGNVVVI